MVEIVSESDRIGVTFSKLTPVRAHNSLSLFTIAALTITTIRSTVHHLRIDSWCITRSTLFRSAYGIVLLVDGDQSYC